MGLNLMKNIFGKLYSTYFIGCLNGIKTLNP